MLRKRLNHLEPRTIRGGSAFLPGLRSWRSSPPPKRWFLVWLRSTRSSDLRPLRQSAVDRCRPSGSGCPHPVRLHLRSPLPPFHRMLKCPSACLAGGRSPGHRRRRNPEPLRRWRPETPSWRTSRSPLPGICWTQPWLHLSVYWKACFWLTSPFFEPLRIPNCLQLN